MSAARALIRSSSCRACASSLPSQQQVALLRPPKVMLERSLHSARRRCMYATLVAAGETSRRGTFSTHPSSSSFSSRRSISTSSRVKIATSVSRTIPPPKAIRAHLDEYVIGQDRAKRALAVGVYNHYIRAALNRVAQDVGEYEEEAAAGNNARRMRSGKINSRRSEEESTILSDFIGQTKGSPRWGEERSATVTDISGKRQSSSLLSSNFFSSLRPGERRELETDTGRYVAETALSVPMSSIRSAPPLPSPPQQTNRRMKSDMPPLAQMDKSNIILCGPSGSGKTHLIRTLSNFLSVPFVQIDATPLTSAGYVGEDVESIMSRLLEAADWNVEEAERGIVCIDEVDKLAGPTSSTAKGTIKTAGRDVGGTGVQQALLRLLEGSIVSVVDKRAGGSATAAAAGQGTLPSPRPMMSGRTGETKPWWSPEMQTLNVEQGKAPVPFKPASSTASTAQGEALVVEKRRRGGGGVTSGSDGMGSVRIDTSKILFVLSGAFVGLEDIVAARCGQSLEQTEPEDLTSYGLIPEFVGRLPVLVTLGELTERDLCRILTEPKNALVSQYQALFAASDIKLHFTTPAIASLAHQAAKTSKNASGARALRRLLEKRLMDAMFDGPNGGARYALMDEKAAQGHSQVAFFSRGGRSAWLSAIEEEEERHKRRPSFKKTKSTSAPRSSTPATKESRAPLTVKLQTPLKATPPADPFLPRIDEATLRRRARARLTRPSRVGNLRILTSNG